MGFPRCLMLLGLLAVPASALVSSDAALGAAVSREDAAAGKPCEYTQIHMGMPVRMVLHAADGRQAEAAARAAFDRIAALDRMMSDYRPDSKLRRLGDAAGRWVPMSVELFNTLIRAREIAEATGGAFDPSIGPLVALWREARKSGRLPDRAALDAARARTGWRSIEVDRERRAVRVAPGVRLDLGGIAKGYILQDGLRTLASHGVTRALVEAGGDIVVGDAPPGRPGWSIDAPGAGPELHARASRLTNAAIATSGPTTQFVEIDGTRYSHVIDPRTGLGVTSPVVARVIAADAATADALATALTVLGPDSLADIRTRFPNVLIDLTEQP